MLSWGQKKPLPCWCLWLLFFLPRQPWCWTWASLLLVSHLPTKKSHCSLRVEITLAYLGSSRLLPSVQMLSSVPVQFSCFSSTSSQSFASSSPPEPSFPSCQWLRGEEGDWATLQQTFYLVPLCIFQLPVNFLENNCIKHSIATFYHQRKTGRNSDSVCQSVCVHVCVRATKFSSKTFNPVWTDGWRPPEAIKPT